MNPSTQQQFRLILIKPSHYDDDGYVIQWFRSSIPSNTMAAIYGLALDCVKRKVLGNDVQIQLTAHDETNTHIRPKSLARLIWRSGGHGMVALVGVQTNQFPRAVDMALQFLAYGIQVCIGGFHVSGGVAMLPEIPRDLQDAMHDGISLYAGELEGRLTMLLQDAHKKALKPLYNFLQDPPSLDSRPVPYLPARLIHRMSGTRTSFDAGRGCPFSCSFCTIINVQGRTSRFRTADDIEKIIRANVAQGIHKFFITDDNFSRNRAWEEIFDRLILLREEEGIAMKLTLQVDTLCHRIPRFIEKAGRAGTIRVFIGLENIHPEALAGSRKTHNNITEYRAMLQAWHSIGALTLAGYILGFPTDTPESILRDIRIIQQELPVDLLEFFILTPLPGSRDHRDLHAQGVPLDRDMNRYDAAHVTAPHANMSADEWLDVYHKAWDAYYSPDHVETVMRRAKAWKFDLNKMKWMMMAFHAAVRIENVHPLDSGLLRRKYRRDRRRGMPLEKPLLFYGRYAWEILTKHARMLRMYLHYQRIYRRVLQGKSKTRGVDRAMQALRDTDLDTMALFTVTDAAKSFAAKTRQETARKKTAAGL